jgi:L-gulono-1,4-lactone dehydrogenase
MNIRIYIRSLLKIYLFSVRLDRGSAGAEWRGLHSALQASIDPNGFQKKSIIKKSKLLILLLVFSFSLQAATWRNWGNTQECYPQEIFYPENKEQVIAIIKKAASKKNPLKAIGSSHSWSNLISTDGFLINTDYLARILWIDESKCQIKVEAGIKLKELIYILDQHGLALSNQGFITDQSIAGATATATHGTGKAFALSDYIIEIEIIDAKGQMHTISEQSHPEWLALARVSLGALGFVYSITLQCEPAFNLKHSRINMDINYLVSNYRNLYETHDFFMFMFSSTHDSAIAYFWDYTQKEPNVGFFHYFANDCVFNRFLNCMAIQALSTTRQLSSYMVPQGLSLLQMGEHVDHSYISLSPIKTPLRVDWYIEQEFAVDFEDFTEAFADLMAIYEHYHTLVGYLMSIITCRFGPASHASYLNPAYGRKTAYITINIMSYFDEYEDFFHDLEQAMMRYKGRAHWGKFHFLDKEKIEKLYDPHHVAAFNELRLLFDPDKLFSNEFVSRCFGS